MTEIPARNVNDAYVKGMAWLKAAGEVANSRNGEMLRVGDPVTTIYERPWERVLFDEQRDANPFFHLMESLWMLAGRNDVEFVSHFNTGMRNFSDDGETFHGAYGYRWRNHFRVDQILGAIQDLTADAGSRRVYISMWDPSTDGNGLKSKDFPCNVGIKFDVRQNALNMYVFNRSNDAIWGAYGANVVHMSFLQECVANLLGVDIGKYYQISTDFHAYCGVFKEKWNPQFANTIGFENPYDAVSTIRQCIPLVTCKSTWWFDLRSFLETGIAATRQDFLAGVAEPVWTAWNLRKSGRKAEARKHLRHVEQNDWRFACEAWMDRRDMK